MINNMNFYDFMHKQIIVLIALFTSTGLGYIYIGYLYGELYFEFIWYLFNILISLWGFKLYKHYKNNDLSLEEKEKWLLELQYFLFIYFFLWTIIFFIYVSKENVELHYIALATQFGCGVVSATILVSQRKLATITLISIMLPLFMYFVLVNEFYSYLLAFFTFVVSLVLQYASANTFNYLVKSKFQSYHDYLTTLGNRRFFTEVLEDALKMHKQNNKPYFLLLIDLDQFKIINDTLGHDIGDELLIEVSKRISRLCNENNYTLARLGGDEFCILSKSFETKQECQNKSEELSIRLLELIKTPYTINETQLYISASIGVTYINSNYSIDASSVIKEADIAMYEAKNKGRDGLIVFSQNLIEEIQKKYEIERLLHFAVENKEIYLEYQPQYNLDSQQYSCEVLARWNCVELGEVSPEIFIPIAEKTGKIIDIGLYILKESILQLESWDQQNIEIENISINISAKQIIHKDFIHEVEKLIYLHLNAQLCEKLIFEITESSTVDDIQLIVESIKKLKRYGIKFSMDDFGTGYSSINYLKELQVDELKIDKSFVHSINSNKENANILEAITKIAHSFHLSIVAEGIENQEQYDFLQTLHCQKLQGNFISEPLSLGQFVAFIEEKQNKHNKT